MKFGRGFLPVVMVQMVMAAGGFALQPDVRAPSSAEPPAGKPAGEGVYTSADGLLDALEKADVGLRTLTADIRYDRVFEIAGDRQIRDGSLVYVDTRGGAQGAGEEKQAGGDKAGGRKFAIHIRSVQIGDRRDADDRWLIFDGEWFVERLDSLKQFTKRRVARPGEKFDPLRLGEGPFPLPIGQKKSDIVGRYDVALLPATQDLEPNDPDNAAAKKALDGFVADCYQLKLTPKQSIREGEELREIRLWYKPGAGEKGEPRLLPRMARTVNRAGDVTLVQLINVKVNEVVDEAVTSTATPEGDWKVQIDDLPREVGGGEPEAAEVPGREPSKAQTDRK